MPAGLDSNSAFLRSHSSSNIPDLVHVQYKRSPTRHDEELPRSASFSCLTALDSGPFNAEEQLSRVVSADVSPNPLGDQNKVRSGKEGKRLTKEERPKLERVGRRKSLATRPKSWMQRVKGSPERTDSPELVNITPSDIPPVPSISKSPRDKTKTVSESC
jgi:hypothetical protein